MRTSRPVSTARGFDIKKLDAIWAIRGPCSVERHSLVFERSQAMRFSFWLLAEDSCPPISQRSRGYNSEKDILARINNAPFSNPGYSSLRFRTTADAAAVASRECIHRQAGWRLD